MLKLQRIRIEKGYTLRSLAKELGVNYSTISYWEQGIKTPRSGNKINLEKILETPSHILFEVDDNE